MRSTAAPADTRFTYDDFLLFPDDGRRHEIIAGEHYVTPAPNRRHQQLVGRLHARVAWFLEAHPDLGEVYLAQDVRLDRKIALKVLTWEFARDEDRVRRFEQEARAASALNHPNVCIIHEVGKTADGRHFMAMEFIDGMTLRRRMAQKRLTLKEVLDVAAQITWALEAAHAAGIIHRDIKPENIMLRRDGYVKVLDFGIAKLNAHPPRVRADHEADTAVKLATAPGTLLGTTKYMSPEQLREQPVDRRSDIWSLGFRTVRAVSRHCGRRG